MTTQRKKKETVAAEPTAEIQPFRQGQDAAELRRQLARPSRPLTVDAFRDRVGRILEDEARRAHLDEDGASVRSEYGLVFVDTNGQDYDISAQEIGRSPGIYKLCRHTPDGREEEIVRCDTSNARSAGMDMRGASPLEATLVHGVGQLTGAWDSIMARQAVEAAHAHEREKELREENNKLRERVAELESTRSGLSNPETLEKLVPLAMKGMETFVRVRSGEDAIIDAWLGRLTPETRKKVCEELEAYEQAEMNRASGRAAPTNGTPVPNTQEAATHH